MKTTITREGVLAEGRRAAQMPTINKESTAYEVPTEISGKT
jgi:hypothetical protein